MPSLFYVYGTLVSLLGVVWGQSDHSLVLYDGDSQLGSWVRLDNYVDDLRSVSFNDLTSSFCVERGIWLLYDYAHYNPSLTGTSAFYWGENFCASLPNELNNLISSVRYAGSPFNWQDDGLNIYEGDWFSGGERFLTNDNVQLNLYQTRSLIVSGRNSWTLYDAPGYGGYHVCVGPADIVSAYPGFYPSPADFGFSTRPIASVRKGCWSRNIVRPLPTEPGKVYYPGVPRPTDP